MRDIRYRGHEIIKERIAKYAIDCDWKDGWMEAAARPKHMDKIRAYYDERVKDGELRHQEYQRRNDEEGDQPEHRTPGDRVGEPARDERPDQ